MKRSIFFIAITLILSATSAIGQIADRARPAFGILGGVNFQNFNGKDRSGNALDNELIMGYHVGANVQIPIVPQFYFQPGLLFSIKGAKSTDSPLTSTYKLSYIEMPLNLVYKASLGTGYILLGFGPYAGYGIMGKAKHEGGSLSYENDIEFTNTVEAGDPLETSYFRPLDIGGNIFAGYETGGGLFIQLNAQLGMVNINPEDKRFPDNELAIKNTGFGLSLGYRF
ncbi:MAG: PorT family protein [Cyclobacteriaceae bacterium]|nr:PorT family protein [Cyclobacteriaceae bacterium]